MAQVYDQAFFGSKIVPITKATVSITSAATLYGLSVYTVLPVCVSSEGLLAFRITEHFKRLIDSAGIIGIDTFAPEWDVKRFETVLRDLITANNINKDVFIRVTVHVIDSVPGTRSRGLATALSAFVYDAEPIFSHEGARLKTSVWRRVPDYAIPSRAKVNGAYVNSVLAKQDALDSGYDDCIFLDMTGHVCESSAANIFIIRDGVLITPDANSDILEGITRRSLLTIAKEAKLKTKERTVDLTELYIADEVFVCGTSAFVTPVIEIDKRQVGTGKIGPITKQLQEAHHKILYREDQQHLDWLTPLS